MRWLRNESALHAVSRIAQTSRADASPELLRQPNVLW